ncbi:hypothetical protein [Neoasaia chiangmaiensis]|uniref:hypothetical protein n=1 Tax=Neoasaia chiangmaiensis TaxID=320497 RepID=UPI001FE442D7|nr:hypothetical protein [Neoasaia chiangmaiensis]
MSDQQPASDDPSMRHDVRNMLATALLAADLLSAHADPAVRRQAETIIAAIESATARLKGQRK